MLLQIAIGDAYGAGFEYVDPALVRAHNDLSGYFQHPRHNIRRGKYTDDAQMSIAVTEVLLSGDYTRERFADAFVSCFKRDVREGYAGGFYAFLVSVKDGADFLARIKPDSDKSGAAMRAVTIGALPTIARVKEVCRLQAALTHNTTDGINAAVATSLGSHYFIYGLGKKAALGTFLEQQVPGRAWSSAWSGKVGAQGWMSVHAAVCAILAGNSMSEILRRCVDFTGDVDTVAAIALGIASRCPEIAQDLPAVLVDNLENGTYGRDYIKDLDRKLNEQIAVWRS